MLHRAHARSIVMAAPVRCLDETTVTLFLDRRLTAARAVSVERHIDSCGECRRLLSALARGRSAESVAPSADLPRRGTRMRGWIALGIALAALGATSFAVARRGDPPACERQLDGVWDAQRRIAARAGMLAAHAPIATIREAEHALDRYTSAWVAMRGEACEATRGRELRIRCLDRRREDVGALVGLLASVTPASVPNIVYAAHGLEPLADCANVAALEAQPVLPANPAIATWQRELAVARTRGLLGDHPASEALAARVAAAAAGVRVRSLEAEALLVEATALERRGDGVRADRVYRDAALAAEASGADRIAAAAQLARIAVATEAGHYDTAHEAVLAASAAVERAGGSNRLRAALTTQEGLLAAAQGRLEVARADFRATLELIGPLRESDDLELARATSNLGRTLLALGDDREAEAAERRALELRRTHLGAAHPDVGASLVALARTLIAQREYAEAAAELTAALAIFEASAATPDELASCRFDLARALWDANGDRERARDLAAQARAGFAALGAPHEHELATVAAWLASHRG